MFWQHILHNHIPWFAKQYGCPAIWSTQGMEKTHYQARGAYFCHTQHGGGTVRGAVSKRCIFDFIEELYFDQRRKHLYN